MGSKPRVCGVEFVVSFRFPNHRQILRVCPRYIFMNMAISRDIHIISAATVSRALLDSVFGWSCIAIQCHQHPNRA